MAHGENPLMNLVGSIMLSEVEETAGLKVKKWKNPAPIAAELADALNRKGGSSIDNFLGIVGEILDAGGMKNEATTVMMEMPILGDKPISVMMPAKQDILDNIKKSWVENEARGGSMFDDLIRLEGQVGRHNIDMASEVMYQVHGRAEQYHASLMAGGAGESAMRKTVSEMGFAKRILDKVDRIRTPKGNKYFMPAMVGLTATAALAVVLGGPGYAAKPLMPKTAKLDPNVNKAIQDGTLLMAARPPRDITPESLSPPYTGGGPTTRPTLPTARLAAPSSNIRVSGFGDMGLARLDRMMAGSRAHFAGSNQSGRVRDDRRPLSPNRPGGYGS